MANKNITTRKNYILYLPIKIKIIPKSRNQKPIKTKVTSNEKPKLSMLNTQTACDPVLVNTNVVLLFK